MVPVTQHQKPSGVGPSAQSMPAKGLAGWAPAGLEVLTQRQSPAARCSPARAQPLGSSPGATEKLTRQPLRLGGSPALRTLLRGGSQGPGAASGAPPLTLESGEPFAGGLPTGGGVPGGVSGASSATCALPGSDSVAGM